MYISISTYSFIFIFSVLSHAPQKLLHKCWSILLGIAEVVGQDGILLAIVLNAMLCITDGSHDVKHAEVDGLQLIFCFPKNAQQIHTAGQGHAKLPG